MEELQKGNSSTQQRGQEEPVSKNFLRAALLILLMIVGGILLENLSGLLGQNGPLPWGMILGGIAVAALTAVVFSIRPFFRVIDTPPFAISILLTLAIGTAIGTFITQNATAEVFTQRYGNTFGSALKTLQIDDLFHSWWYVGFFLLLSFSLIKISLRKNFNLQNLGFHLAHLSPVIILAGFWIDHFYGYRGIVQLEEGESKNRVRLYAGHTNYITDTAQLDFSIRLDNFEFEKHDPDYRIQVWKQDTSGQNKTVSHQTSSINKQPPEIVASLKAEPMKIRHIYGTDIYFRMIEMYPNFTFTYSYPEDTDGIEVKDPGVQLKLTTPEGDGTMQLLARNQQRNKILDAETLGGWLECYWELPEEVQKVLQNPPSASETNRVILACEDRKIHYVVDGKVSTDTLIRERYYPFPGKIDNGFELMYVFEDASLMKAVPSTKDDQLVNPVARVEIWRAGKQSQETYIYPASPQRRAGTFSIPGSPFLLAYESFKDRETKYYKSDLTVLNEAGDPVLQQVVKVNEPMLYEGHRFYQTDYDPKNPSYSGIGVTYNPGLYLIYFGFYVLVAGVGWMFYNKN